MDADTIIDLIERGIADWQRIVNGVKAGSLSPEEAAAQWASTADNAKGAVADWNKAKAEKGIG